MTHGERHQIIIAGILPPSKAAAMSEHRFEVTQDGEVVIIHCPFCDRTIKFAPGGVVIINEGNDVPHEPIGTHRDRLAPFKEYLS